MTTSLDWKRKAICDRLCFKCDGYEYDLEFQGQITVLGGDGATGKTFLYNKLVKLQNLPEYSYLRTFNHSTKDFCERLRECHNNLVIIDNADILLTDSDKDFINWSLDNQFLIIAYDVRGLNVGIEALKELKQEGHHITFKGQFDGLLSAW